jgi:hypothetical protein
MDAVCFDENLKTARLGGSPAGVEGVGADCGGAPEDGVEAGVAAATTTLGGADDTLVAVVVVVVAVVVDTRPDGGVEAAAALAKPAITLALGIMSFRGLGSSWWTGEEEEAS